MKTQKSLFVLIFCMFTISFSSCIRMSNVEVKNNTYTPVTINFDGEERVIEVGATEVFSVEMGKDVRYTAKTCRKYTAYDCTGLLVTWDEVIRPNKKVFHLPIDFEKHLFFLEVKNTGSINLHNFTVEYSDGTKQTNYGVSVPNDGKVYGIGYYNTKPIHYIYAHNAAGYPINPNGWDNIEFSNELNQKILLNYNE